MQGHHQRSTSAFKVTGHRSGILKPLEMLDRAFLKFPLSEGSMTRLIVMTPLLASMFIALTVGAQQDRVDREFEGRSPSGITPESPTRAKKEEIVLSCAAHVRRQSNEDQLFPDSTFAASIEPDGSVSAFGTLREKSRFGDCMKANGFPLPTPKD